MNSSLVSFLALLVIVATVSAQFGDFEGYGPIRARRATYTYNGVSATYPYYRNGATFSSPTNGYNNNGQYYYNAANTNTFTSGGNTFRCSGGYTYNGAFYPYCSG
ncbi:unnamed protein product, partial [Mesorhabditis belari]|uniref:Uncharacterized protein n=1 Tax=Mesorhabditis belari TaxID=2138241 RepID=A0AAF3EQI9_9BILA